MLAVRWKCAPLNIRGSHAVILEVKRVLETATFNEMTTANRKERTAKIKWSHTSNIGGMEVRRQMSIADANF